jgi:hypothetical protein
MRSPPACGDQVTSTCGVMHVLYGHVR